MGMNTAMIVRNDFLHEIQKDRDFGSKVFNAIISAGRGDYHGQSFDVLPCCHADYVQVVAIGGNTIRRLGGYAGTYANTDEEVLRNLADSMGFRLVKKAGRKVR